MCLLLKSFYINKKIHVLKSFQYRTSEEIGTVSILVNTVPWLTLVIWFQYLFPILKEVTTHLLSKQLASQLPFCIHPPHPPPFTRMVFLKPHHTPLLGTCGRSFSIWYHCPLHKLRSFDFYLHSPLFLPHHAPLE